MSLERRMQRFRRLAGLDQLRLERAVAELMAANEARSMAVSRLDKLREEYTTTLAACEGNDLAQRRQTSLWADWSRREQEGAFVDLEKKTAIAEEKRLAVLQARRRTESWERLLQRLDRQRQAALVKRDYAGADELAVRQHWLGQLPNPDESSTGQSPGQDDPGCFPSGQRAGSAIHAGGVNDRTGSSDCGSTGKLSNRQPESAAHHRLELYP
jgi:hypothetical protein